MAGLGFKDFTVGEVLTSSDVDGYLMQQTVMRFADSGARGSALGTASGTGVALAEGMVSYLDDSNVLSVYDGARWRDLGYTLQETVYFTASGTFVPDNYSYLRGVEAFAVGGGGGGGGAASGGNVAQSGGGGGLAAGFLEASSLGTAVTVTVGAGGAGGASGSNPGAAGGSSSFGTAVAASGGGGGGATPTGGIGTAGDLLIQGGNGASGVYGTYIAPSGPSAGGFGVGTPIVAGSGNRTGDAGTDYGGGGGGARGGDSSQAGGDGGDGIVILRLYS